jgi:hypothetical protein
MLWKGHYKDPTVCNILSQRTPINILEPCKSNVGFNMFPDWLLL